MADAVPTLTELFQAHRQGLVGSVRSVLGAADATEILQDAFLKCWRAWQHGTRPDDPAAWIFVVVWNVAVDARRKRQRRPIHETLDEESPLAPTLSSASPTRALEQAEAVAAAQAAVAGLSDPEQQVFLMRVSGELSFEAVATALAIPIGTAKTRMRSALQKLRQKLGTVARNEESTR